jgi:uncharacterized RDD family membrane protein YckC
MYCAECGGALTPGARYCIRCGTPTTGAETVTLGDSTFTTAGFGRRLAGHLIDAALTYGAWITLVIIAIVDAAASECAQTSEGLCLDYGGTAFSPYTTVLLLRGVPFVYWTLWNSLGTSPGKWLLGTKLVTARGRAPGLKWGTVRALVAILASGTALQLGYLWALGDREHRTWHDHAARTWVVRK